MRNIRSAKSKPKDFLAIKGPWSLSITPQTPRGWRLFGVWTAILLLPTLPLALFAAAVDDTAREHWVLIATVPFLIIMGLLAWTMTRWMLARSDIVRPDELTAWRAEHNQGRKNAGRRS
jgi:hypothetical protein